MIKKLLIDRNKKNNESNESDDLFIEENIRDKNLLSIGDLAKYCMVSTKTLRHYDKKGILKPAYIDSKTGYRYYSEEQLFWLVMIKRLKQRNFSLEEAKEYLETGDIKRIRELFEKKEDEIDKEIKKLQQIKKMISLKKDFFEDFLSVTNRDVSKSEIVMKDLPERKILSIRKNDFFNIKTLADSLSRLHLLQENNCIKSEGLWMTSKSSENITSELQICIKE
jgi:DNA-binding transcriptional MerR regulator